MKPKFRVDKTTQAACWFIQNSPGNTIPYMSLVKLLYLADREALLRWGRPISYDSYVSMNHGTVMSRTLNLINGSEISSDQEYWSSCVSPPVGDHEVRLLKNIGTDNLSEGEERLLGEIFAQFGDKTQWELSKYTHTLPEWKDPHGSSIPIQYRDILLGAGKTEIEAQAIEDEIEELGMVNRILS